MASPAEPTGEPTNTEGETGRRCTDNFQIAPFEYAGRTWQSVEQAYQALKWTDAPSLDAWEKELPEQAESAFAYGNRMWQLARTMKSGEKVADFDANKVQVMYLLNCAKYAQNSDLQQQLLATGSTPHCAQHCDTVGAVR